MQQLDGVGRRLIKTRGCWWSRLDRPRCGYGAGQRFTKPADAGRPDSTGPDGMPMPEYNGPRKKGIAIHQRSFDWSEKVAAVKPFWSYSWGSQIEPIPTGRYRVRAYAMVWGVKR